ncbi:SubName: Full=Related to S.pombe pac2 protein {ECO:0000313/EMBL:CCA68276.1} [Serendipita indica DSM 11827]|uniref:Related to S.pombe pac2 protein n=1 Tax=Serendipita indica (strain DSM 11827) TaxID=1109443 RepID=G4TAC6_SERID|nr:SubName: Full=Related to S.pombe pac2 protein {ECO:0000313/EMBL:CCA68276.1} [Serendipita indica DSM 11827]CCA68276.1 related to S.pombe pac2 protein [Serendipita indica DSM 11827]
MASPAEDQVASPAENESPAWPEPPWSGWIETTGDALLILEAARRGLIPRVTRRLVDSERKMITSGSVFVFDEDESGIKRWTDGFIWSPSRILGNFLLYRETEKRGNNRSKAEQDAGDSEGVPKQAKVNTAQALTQGLDKHRERLLLGSLTNSHKFKVDGMIKKTFSLTIGGVSQHLISYYRVADVENGRLRSPSSLPELATLEISPEYLDKTHFRQPPRVEVGPDGIPRYRGEADDPELSGVLRGTEKTGRRFDPYSSTSAPKKPKKPRSQRAASQSESDVSQYPADAYGYPSYPGYPYGGHAYPYMQYPVGSGSEDAAQDGSNYGAYMGGYYWPGYGSSGHAAVENGEEEDTEKQTDGEQNNTSDVT